MELYYSDACVYLFKYSKGLKTYNTMCDHSFVQLVHKISSEKRKPMPFENQLGLCTMYDVCA